MVVNNNIRIVTATSLFDGHDAAINIMRRILQSKGVEVIHLGHNRSVHEIVECAIEEDVQAIAVTSYQGGHVEFFRYMKDLLVQNESGHIKIFGGGGGTILPEEITLLHKYGINRIYSPDDGRQMGLEGMIEDLLSKCSPITINLEKSDKTIGRGNGHDKHFVLGEWKDILTVSRAITLAENGLDYKLYSAKLQHPAQQPFSANSIVLGITGTGGAGKSSVTDEIVRRFLNHFQHKTIAVISVDPSKRKPVGLCWVTASG